MGIREGACPHVPHGASATGSGLTRPCSGALGHRALAPAQQRPRREAFVSPHTRGTEALPGNGGGGGGRPGTRWGREPLAPEVPPNHSAPRAQPTEHRVSPRDRPRARSGRACGRPVRFLAAHSQALPRPPRARPGRQPPRPSGSPGPNSPGLKGINSDEGGREWRLPRPENVPATSWLPAPTELKPDQQL